MKKRYIYFIIAISASLSIAFYARLTLNESNHIAESSPPVWKTFIKKENNQITSYDTTEDELATAKIAVAKKAKLKFHQMRTPASDLKIKNFNYQRAGRILIGDVSNQYEDEKTFLKMKNKINPKWRELMGVNLMRFQPSSTKLLVKEESSIIKIEGTEGAEGQFLEEIKVTYLLSSGDKRSFSALVDSETGEVVETWNRTLEEKIERNRKPAFSFSGQQGQTDHGIIVR